MREHNYYIYIVTNPAKTVLYVGVTNNLDIRIIEHYFNRGKPKTFAGKYHCYNLLHYELFNDIHLAISREKEIKGWLRAKKIALVSQTNPKWEDLSSGLFEVDTSVKMKNSKNDRSKAS